MKKVVAICLMMVMVLSMSVNVFAAPGGFVSSPSGNPAPEVVIFAPSDDDCKGRLVVTAYGDRHDLSEALREMLEKAYKDFSDYYQFRVQQQEEQQRNDAGFEH